MENNFTDLYLKWLKENLKSTVINTELGQFTQISTPFMDRHNDHLQIYVKEEDQEFHLTDGGYIISDLEMCGCDVMSTPKRCSILSEVVSGFGVKLKGGELCIKANLFNFAQKKHALLQAMLSVNDMFFLSQSHVANVFLEDVQLFFDINSIRYVLNAQFQGSSGLSHTFEFTIPATRIKPERFVKTINDVSRDKIDSVLFSWGDIRKLRRPNAELYVMMNDTEKPVRTNFTNALSNYGGKPMFWTKRDEYIKDLTS